MLQRLADPKEFPEIWDRLVYLAWYKYHIASRDAEDIAQTAITAYCEFRDRYRHEKNQFAILIGIFNKKCLAYIDRSARDKRKLDKFVNKSDAQRTVPYLNPDGNGRGALEEVIRKEESRLILEAIDELRPEAREMFRILVEDGKGRKGVLEHYALNKNTIDTRLHVYRRELKEILQRKGVLI